MIYQLVVRYFGNVTARNVPDGELTVNGCGQFADINEGALRALRTMGVTHVWLTGVLRQATLTDYSAVGLPAHDPDVVKGLAGSFYAVCDYFDVCPDYAGADPSARMAEFEALMRRIHDAGLLVIIDFVSNHVSRAYASSVKPEENLGRLDRVDTFFDSQNHFFYLVDPPGQVLRLSKSTAWNPPDVVFDGHFGPEDGSAGHPPKATGNNCTSPTPAATDWYETIKLNYGFNFASGQAAYSPVPRTWVSMDTVLAYWQGKGIDGFRCDFAHYVPAEAWSYLIARARARRPSFFLAEAYPQANSTDPVRSQEALVQAGFDALYHYQSYNALKNIYRGGSIDEYDQQMVSLPATLRAHAASYLENHDERRVASAIVTGGGPGDSGFGSAEAAYQLAPLQFLYSNSAVLVFNGQEVGETGAGAEGYGGEDGRTTIYDYWTMLEFAKWVNGHLYDGAALSPSQLSLRSFYSSLLQLCRSSTAAAEGYWGLRYFNRPERFADCPADLYSFARYVPGSGTAWLIVANFRPGSVNSGRIRVPADLAGSVAFPQNLVVERILERTDATRTFITDLTLDRLQTSGFDVTVPNQTTSVYEVRPSPL